MSCRPDPPTYLPSGGRGVQKVESAAGRRVSSEQLNSVYIYIYTGIRDWTDDCRSRVPSPTPTLRVNARREECRMYEAERVASFRARAPTRSVVLMIVWPVRSRVL